MVVDLHPGIAVLVVVLVAWLIHRALRPCKCCTHHGSYNPDDFK